MHWVGGLIVSVAVIAIINGMDGVGALLIGCLLLFVATCFADYRLTQARAEIARRQAEQAQDRALLDAQGLVHEPEPKWPYPLWSEKPANEQKPGSSASPR